MSTPAEARNRLWIAFAVVLVAGLLCTGRAHATYPGISGAIAWEVYAVQPDGSTSDRLETLTGTITACDNSSGSLACDFGRLSYSPDGNTVVVSRQVPIAGTFGQGNQGSLMLVGADGSAPRTLPRQTADDEDPAFLPSGQEIVFAGRSAPGATPNLYTIKTDGSGLRQLTSAGGSSPAPCANGTVAFVRSGNVYLVSADRSSERRLTGGLQPSCSPDSRRIAFVRDGRLYTIGTDGAGLTHVPTSHSPSFPTYSPDGAWIAYQDDYDVADGSVSELTVASLKGRVVLRYPLGQTIAGTHGETQEQSQAGAIAWQPTARQPPPSGSLSLVAGSPFSAARRSMTCSVAFSPNGRLVATANTRPTSIPLCQYFEAGGGSVSVFSVQPSGALRSVRHSPFATGKQLDTRSVAFSPNGKLLAAANTRIRTTKLGIRSAGSSVSVYSVGRSGTLGAIRGSPFPNGAKLVANALAFSPDGRLLAVANSRGKVTVFSVGRRGALRAVRGSPFGTGTPYPATGLAFSPSGLLLATANFAPADAKQSVSVLALNPRTGALRPVAGSPFEVDSYVFSVAFSPTGKLLAVATFRGVAMFSVDPASGRLTRLPTPSLPGGESVAFGRGGQLLASPSGGGVAMFSVNDPTGALSLVPGERWMPDSVFTAGTETAGTAIAFDADGRRLALANLSGSVSMFAIR